MYEWLPVFLNQEIPKYKGLYSVYLYIRGKFHIVCTSPFQYNLISFSFIHFFIATNVKTHSPLHMTKTYYDYVTR